MTQQASQKSKDADSLLGKVVDDYFDQLSRGESPDLKDYVERYPEIADAIRHGFPALKLVGQSSPGSVMGEESETLKAKELGDFRIIRQIGRGGMGVVYQAEQMSLGRMVALKVLPFAAVLDPRQIQRFKNEAHAAAQLHHTNIVPVFGVGCERGVYYYAMQYIEGQTLTEVISELRQIALVDDVPNDADDGLSGSLAAQLLSNHTRGHVPSDLDLNDLAELPTSERASSETRNNHSGLSTEELIRSPNFYRNAAILGAQIADALQCAHEQGIVHRDIKPSNLILDRQGKIWVTDFGLAHIESDAGVTMTGDVVGTLRYMSPEQILAKPGIDHRADIYSLGVTLYELLTLQPAAGDKNRQETIKQVAVGQPRLPRKINRSIPWEWETIVLKAMEKEPQQRYASAHDLADDLRRFVERRPITARRPTLIDRTVKWSRRHSDLSWAAAIFLLIGIIGTTVAAIWLSRLYREAKLQGVLAVNAQLDSEMAKENLREQLYAKDMKSAFDAWRNHWSGDVDRLLLSQVPEENEIDYRGFEWYLLKQLNWRAPPVELAGHDGPVNNIAVFDQGTRLASVGDDGTIRIWDLESQRELFVLRDERVTTKDPPVYSAVAISPDGKQLVTGKNVLSLWDLEERRFVRDLMTFPTRIWSVAFSPDGRLVAAHSANELLKVVSLAEGEVLRYQTDHGSHRFSFSPDGTKLVVPYKKKPIQGLLCWDTSTWNLIHDYEVKSPRGMAFSGDGQYLFLGIYGSYVRLMDILDGKILLATEKQRSRVADLAVSPDDRTLAAMHDDGSLVYWRLREDWQSDPRNAIDGELTLLPAHERPANAVRFVDNYRVATCADDGLVRIWAIAELSASPRLSSDRWLHAFSPDGTEIWVANGQGIRIHDAKHLKILNDIELWQSKNLPQENLAFALAFSKDNRYAAVGNKLGTLVLWDRNAGREVLRIDQTDIRSSEIDDIAFSPDGQWLACASDDHTLRVRSMDDWEEVIRFDANGQEGTVEFSPDGGLLAISSSECEIGLRETNSWREVARAITKSPLSRDGLRFTPDGTRIVTAHLDSRLRVWDATTLALIGGAKRTQVDRK